MAEELSAGGHEQEEESALTESAPESAGPDASDTKLTPEDVQALNTAREALSAIATPLVTQWESEK